MVTEITISKGKEVYHFDTEVHQLPPKKVYHRTTKLAGIIDKKGEYDVKVRFIEDGEEIGVESNLLEIKSGKEAFNASLIFYFIMIGIIGWTGYVFYSTMKKR